MIKNEPSISECLLFGGRLMLSVYDTDDAHLITYATKTGIVKIRLVDYFLYGIPHWVNIKLQDEKMSKSKKKIMQELIDELWSYLNKARPFNEMEMREVANIVGKCFEVLK